MFGFHVFIYFGVCFSGEPTVLMKTGFVAKTLIQQFSRLSVEVELEAAGSAVQLKGVTSFISLTLYDFIFWRFYYVE